MLESGELAKMLAPDGEQSFRIAVKLLLGVGGQRHGQHGEHHALVAGSEIIQKLLALPALKLHIIGNDGRKVVVAVLPPLPVGNVGFHAQDALFHFAHGLVGGDGDNIEAQNHVAVEVAKFGHHAVFDEVGVVPQKYDTPKFAAHLEVIFFKLKGVRADKVLEAVALPHGLLRVPTETTFLSGTEKVMENPQSVPGVQ